MESNQKLALIILDGWGIGKDDPRVNAIAKAKTPFYDMLITNYPNSTLITYGEDVGLPTGQMGNSEVGHMNIGAGRVVYQQLVKINKSFRDGEMEKHPVLIAAFNYANENNKKIHLLGLTSDGGVHSSLDHLKGLCRLASKYCPDRVFIHAFTDGRDTDPKSGEGFIAELEESLKVNGGKIASVIGRYYAMDRDKRWERVKLAYGLLVKGEGTPFKDAISGIRFSYKNGLTDEFIKPIVITNENQVPLATIAEGDVVIFFNFRTDRGRELTTVLSQEDFPDFGMQKLQLNFITMTTYDKSYENIKVLFDEQDLKMTLGEAIEQAGKSQVRVAETEKYPHVTFFFSGGRETPFGREKRLMIPSPKVATYDMQPSMSAVEIATEAIKEINNEKPDFVALNFANPDMVGHTGVFDAVVQAIETVDKCAEKLVNCCLENDYIVILIADHGNADFMVNEDGTPNTAHTMNPVPFILIDQKQKWEVKNGKLADLAPTILKLMGIEKPEQMNGNLLIS
jgi:2,3-bisphosphoglycerate-independent phosphoglycerate mutase